MDAATRRVGRFQNYRFLFRHGPLQAQVTLQNLALPLLSTFTAFGPSLSPIHPFATGGHTMQDYDYDNWLATDPADALEAEREQRIARLEAEEYRAEADREER